MKKVLGMLSCVIALTALAELPLFSIVGPPPAVFDVQLSYTVTNNATYPLNSIGLQYAPIGVTAPSFTQITTGPNACGAVFNLNAGASCILYYEIDSSKLVNLSAIGGPQICYSTANPIYCSVPDAASNLNLVVQTPNLIVGESNNLPLIVESYRAGGFFTNIPTPVPPPTTVNDNFKSVGCNDSLCVAAGIRIAIPTAPIVISSIDDGLSWQTTILPTLSATLSASTACMPGSESRCIVAGTQTNGGDQVPYVYDFDFNTSSWVNSPITGSAFLYAADCGSSYCVVGGSQGILAADPAKLYTSFDGAWTPTLPTVSGTFPRIVAIFCEGTFCLGMGEQTNGATINPFFVRSFDGITWQVFDNPGAIGPFNPTEDRTTLSCIGSYCIAGGINSTTNASKLIQSFDAGATWSEVTNLGTLTGNGYNGVSCSTGICVAIASSGTGAYIYAQTRDKGLTWTNAPLTTPVTTELNHVSCSASFCIMAGYDDLSGSELAVAYQTLNAGQTWTQVGFSPPMTAPSRFWSLEVQ